MPFDSTIRNRLQKMVGACRQALTVEFTSQLQSLYGIQPTGEMAALASMTHLDDEQLSVASLLRERIEHLASGLPVEKTAVREAIDRLIREQAFTVLNRLAALRMCEERGIVQECVRGGLTSRGFQVYSTTAGASIGDTYDRYRTFLQCLFDEISLDLGVLFDRFSPFSWLFPREPALLEVIKALNKEELKDVWKDDETIGWIYQYFNSKEEREAMRKASAAPRNSRELAVRNQFFTPRFVVEFLTDNTLGRIWYEMCQGETRLKTECHYLVKRPDEVFLSVPIGKVSGDAAAKDDPVQWLLEGTELSFPPFEATESSTDRLIRLAHCVNGYARHPFEDEVDGKWWPLWVKEQIEQGKPITTFSTQELMDTLFGLARADRQSSPYSTLLEEASTLSIANEIRRRAIESRRTDLSQQELLQQPVFIPLREVKDPREIRMLDPTCGSMHFGLYCFDLYEKIYEEAWDNHPKLLQDLRKSCASKEEFLKQVPALILRYNIHGIDIDPRAVQIAGLSLWLRAQRSYQRLGLKAHERPRIAKLNVVTAEPMPGEEDMRREFTAGLKPRVLGQLVDEVFEKMELAGEAGSLLKIEEEIKAAVAEANRQWLEGPKPEQLLLYPERAPKEPKQLEMQFDTKSITDERFWEQAEDRILDALKDYAERAETGRAVRRRLFAEDAARGFAFIDLCRKRYDVVLMNPPFGEPPSDVQRYIASHLPEGRNDIYAALITRCASLMVREHSMLGAITSRAFVVGRDLRSFRASLLTTRAPRLALVWDLGGGVLDGAMVETCTYVLRCDGAGELLYQDSRKATSKVDETGAFSWEGTWTVEPLEKFRRSPDSQLVFGDAGDVLASLENAKRFVDGSDVTQGLTTEDDIRFIRSSWEIDPRDIGSKWFLLTKGGDYSWYSSDVHLVVNRDNEGAEMAAFAAQNSGNVARTRQSSKHYFKPAVTYSRRSQKGFSARRLRRGCCFSDKSGVIVPHKDSEKWLPLLPFLLSSSNYLGLIHAQSKFGSYEVGAVKRLPWPGSACIGFHQAAEDIYRLVDQMDVYEETALLFFMLDTNPGKCGQMMSKILSLAEGLLSNLKLKLDKAVVQNQLAVAHQRDALLDKASSLSFVIGAIYGRWDVRIATDPSLAPKLPDPFDPLPACPPGMLIGLDGLSAKSGNIVSEEWLRARPNAITLPPEGSVSKPTIPDSEYPLRISWDGILVEDESMDGESSHLQDIVHRVREILEVLWGDKAQAIEQEACEILGVSELRDYFRKPTGFFEDHLQRYSKSRRKAPIYWPLSTESGSYTLWIYYHRLTDQMLYKCVNDFVSPRLESVTQDVEKLRLQLTQGGTAKQREQLEMLQKFQQELTDFRDELLRVAELPYQPNLNDGVLITASPLHKLFRLPKWRKELEACWQKLQAGDYDWAHLAYSIWPERVRQKCKADKSIAIAHGLEELYEEPETQKKSKRSKKG